MHLLHFCRVGHLQVWRLERLGSLQQGKSAEEQKGFGDDDARDKDCDNTDELDDPYHDNYSGYQGIGESKVPKEGDRFTFLSLTDL